MNIDINNSNGLDMDEFTKFIDSLNTDLERWEIEYLFNDIAKNGTAEIFFDDFFNYI